MKKLGRSAAWAMLLAAVLAALPPASKALLFDKGPQLRTLVGQVTDQQNKPLADSIVYLKNTKTMAVKTYIVGHDGSYRFSALSPNVDYEVYAEHKGNKSPTRTLSSFDSRTTAHINLKIKE